MLFLSLFLKRFVTLLVGPVSQEAVTEAVGDKENRLCVEAIMLHASISFSKLELKPIHTTQLTGFLCFCLYLVKLSVGNLENGRKLIRLNLL